MNEKSSLPKISIVTVSFNHAEFIKKNIESVLEQNYPNFEHIIVDGGSNDGTVEILRSYPHLIWTSEKDRGQSDALNKGFSRATGDIIGWLNSDDWYAPNIFFDVAEALKDYPIVLGMGQETDKEGNPKQLVENIERNFFDVLKYWVPYAWLAQPPVFFRKSLLEAVKRPDATYIDENLFFTMDYDLWVRMAAQLPFNRRIDKILAYYRIYDENKTGKYPLATQRECGRVFRRYSYTLSSTEHTFSIIIPIRSIGPDISETLKSVAAQNLRDVEILFVDYSGNSEDKKRLHDVALELSNVFDHNSIRFISSPIPELYHALNAGFEAACAPFLVTLQQGDVLGSDFLLKARELFLPDCQGLALPLSWDANLKSLMHDTNQTGLEIKIGSIFRMPYIFPNLIARKVCLMEVGAFHHEDLPPYALRELIAKIAHKSWAISINNSLSLEPAASDYRDEKDLLRVFEPYINAKIMWDLNQDLQNDPFAKLRLKSGITFAIPEGLQSIAEKILSTAPKDWERMEYLNDRRSLISLSKQYPEFAPSWYFLARVLEGEGNKDEARIAQENFDKIMAHATRWY
ncbi:MAG: glycosyltransferase [SAR324 cluster bacterium]|uniref:Glycosyltransferase n=1 Tax=SAR324 cluster bacterium TaxID=2024889 RepID=A0A7X9FT37_9DELT|nr:glycosyltransferase [SAR324 cluster bacterium]